MAIERVGGSKVYVIRGSGRDPRLTSTGQSWANLVTQQKKILWQEAQKQALQEIRYEEMNVQQKQQVQSELKRQLNTQIRDTTKSIQRLEVGEIESAQAIKERLVYTQNLNSRRYSTGGTEKVDPLEKQLQTSIGKQDTSIASTQKTIQGIEKGIQALKGKNNNLADLNATEIDAMEQSKATYQIKLQEHQTERDKLSLQRDSIRLKQKNVPFTKVTSGGGVSGTSGGGAEAVSTTPIDFSDQIKKLEDQRTILQDELKELITLENTKPDLIDRTRGIYYDKFGNAPANLQLPEQKAQFQPRAEIPVETYTQMQPDDDFETLRSGEFDVLGMNNTNQFQGDPGLELGDEYETFETTNEYVRKNFTKKIQDNEYSVAGKTELALEMLRDLPFPPQSQHYEDVKEGIIKAWELEVNPEQIAIVNEAKIDARNKQLTINSEKTYIQDLVASLYAPSTMDKSKRQEAFNNAANELKLYYKGDRKSLKEANKELIAIQEAEDNSPLYKEVETMADKYSKSGLLKSGSYFDSLIESTNSQIDGDK